jgi:hypothetical protein
MATKEELLKMSSEELLKEFASIRDKNSALKARLDTKEDMVRNHPLEQFKNKLPPEFVPTNIGEIQKLYWGYLFSVRNVIIGPGDAQDYVLNITEDASFALKNVVKAVFIRTGASGSYSYEYQDPEISNDANLASGLSFSMMDSASSRSFMNNPIPLEMVGDAKYPMVMKRTYGFLPNANIKFSFANNHPTRTYILNLSLGGFRIRIPGQNQMNSLSS